jgi:hypothetical protein
MNKSNSIQNLAKALSVFQLKVGKINKDSVNPFFKSKYASLSNILDAISLPLNESGLTFSQLPSGENGLTTILIHSETGEFMEADYTMTPSKNDPQGVGSAITYQRRYALASILGLNIDEDDDGNVATHGAKTPEEAVELQKPWLNYGSKEFNGAVAKLKAGTTTIAKIRTVMRVSKKTEERLQLALQ